MQDFEAGEVPIRLQDGIKDIGCSVDYTSSSWNENINRKVGKSMKRCQLCKVIQGNKQGSRFSPCWMILYLKAELSCKNGGLDGGTHRQLTLQAWNSGWRWHGDDLVCLCFSFSCLSYRTTYHNAYPSFHRGWTKQVILTEPEKNVEVHDKKIRRRSQTGLSHVHF